MLVTTDTGKREMHRRRGGSLLSKKGGRRGGTEDRWYVHTTQTYMGRGVSRVEVLETLSAEKRDQETLKMQVLPSSAGVSLWVRGGGGS